MILTLDETKDITQSLYELYQYNILNYDLAFVQRSLIKFSNMNHISDFISLKKFLLEDESLIHDFFDTLFINVSEMYRDPKVFKEIRDQIIPYIASYPIIKIWSAGCAHGQEAYSLAIMLIEAGLYERSIIYATDIDQNAIDVAMYGRYKVNNSLKFYENYYLSGGNNRFSNYFEFENGEMIVKDEIKKNICFTTHNIITDDVFNSFSLIVCRNMFIYFDKDLQQRGLRTFKNSLEENGFLVLGKSESIDYNGGNYYFKEYDSINKIYKLKNGLEKR